MATDSPKTHIHTESYNHFMGGEMSHDVDALAVSQSENLNPHEGAENAPLSMELGLRSKLLGVASGVMLAAGAVVPASAQRPSKYDPEKYVAHSEKYLKKNCPITLDINLVVPKLTDSRRGFSAVARPVKVGNSIADNGRVSPDYAQRYSWRWNPKILVFCGAIGGRGFAPKNESKVVRIKPDNLSNKSGNYTTTVSGDRYEVVTMRLFARNKRK